MYVVPRLLSPTYYKLTNTNASEANQLIILDTEYISTHSQLEMGRSIAIIDHEFYYFSSRLWQMHSNANLQWQFESQRGGKKHKLKPNLLL